MRYIVWLQSVLGAGNNRTVKILEHFGSAYEIFKLGSDGCANTRFFTKSELERMNKIGLSDAIKTVADCKDADIAIIPFGSNEYPYCLSVIENPPLVLYVKGKMPDFDKTPAVCIVGPRKVSDFGKKAAFSLGFRLAGSGMVVVSGGALGTDTYAHAGALRSGGITVQVAGCGILSNYLPENAALRNEITKKGCIISEYPPNAGATKFTFPMRNRIMSALSLGTVVVEAGKRSGALITARHAYEQGRDVFVIPGTPDKKEYIGSNALLRDGAKPLLDVSDIFNEYIVRFPDKINIERAMNSRIISNVSASKSQEISKVQKNLQETLSKEAKIVYNQLDKQKFLPEEICNTGLDTQQLLSALTELEMEFLIRALPGGMYEKC